MDAMDLAPVVCREVFDENSQPSAEEISEYAQQIGIDPESESHLLPLARDGLMQALAPPWKAYYDESRSTHYYFNEDTKITQWEHPVDNVYRELVRKARDASTHDDTCASVQDLNTYEENTKVLEHAAIKADSDDDAFSTDSEHQSEAKPSRTASKQLVFGRPPLAPLIRPFDKKLGDLRISPLRRSVDGSISSKSKNYNVVEKEFGKLQGRHKLSKQQSEIIDLNMQLVQSPEEDHFNLLSLSGGQGERGLPFSGKGGMFIKNKVTDLPSPDTEKSLPLDSVTKSDSLKGILREKIYDYSHKNSETLSIGKTKPVSFEEDRKSVRFKLESPVVDATISPTSNSSSDQNDGQSSIISAPPDPTTVPSLMSPVSPSVPSKLSPLVPNFGSNKLQLSPLGRPPLPPRPPGSFDMNSSPKEPKSASVSDKESFETDSSNDRLTSPKRRLLRPPAADYIKADLFKKNFHKISDLVKPGDVDISTSLLDEPERPEADMRPRSPMIPQKSKISINLMESIESETSIDSPDKEFANLDLNDMNDMNAESQNNTKHEPETSEGKENVSLSQSTHSNCSSKHKKYIIEPYTLNTELRNRVNQDESKTNSGADSVDGLKNLEVKPFPTFKSSPVHSLSLELPRSPRGEEARGGAGAGWSPGGAFKPPSLKLNLSTSDSSTSLKQGMSSPKLDGVIISQGKSFNRGSDVVVMYQFEKPQDVKNETPQLKMKPLLESPRETSERTKSEERRRLELSLYKEIEEMRADWAAKERKMRIEFQKDLKNNEEKFLEEKRIRLQEQAENQRKDLEKALQAADRDHKAALESAASERKEKLRRDAENMEQQYREGLVMLREEYTRKLDSERRAMESEGDMALSELRDQIQAKLNRERVRIIDETKAVLVTLQEEQAARVADLRQDYRAEVDRLRTQHACHVDELRARLASERAAATRRRPDDAALPALADKYRCLKEKYARLKHDVKLSIERRNKRREMSMTTGSETEKSNSHKGAQSLERCKEANEAHEASSSAAPEPPRIRVNNNPVKYNDNETSLSESQAPRSDNNNDEWKRKDNNMASPETSVNSSAKPGPARAHRRTAVAFREPPRRRRDRDHETGATTDFQDSSDATTADEKPKEQINGHGRRRCFTRLKSASTSRLNYSPKRGEGWSSPLESLRQQLRKLDDLEDQFPDLACQPAYSLRYPFAELGEVASADTPELEFVRHRALVEREGMRRARAVLRRRRAALHESRTAVAPSAPSEERETTELEVALHRARALLGEKEIRLRHIERALRRIAEAHPPIVVQEVTSDGSSGSEAEPGGVGVAASGAVLRSLRALHADVRDIWLALDARRPVTASPETSSYNPASSPQPRHSLSAHDTTRADTSDGGVAERARGLRAWLQTAP